MSHLGAPSCLRLPEAVGMLRSPGRTGPWCCCFICVGHSVHSAGCLPASGRHEGDPPLPSVVLARRQRVPAWICPEPRSCAQLVWMESGRGEVQQRGPHLQPSTWTPAALENSARRAPRVARAQAS